MNKFKVGLILSGLIVSASMTADRNNNIRDHRNIWQMLAEATCLDRVRIGFEIFTGCTWFTPKEHQLPIKIQVIRLKLHLKNKFGQNPAIIPEEFEESEKED